MPMKRPRTQQQSSANEESPTPSFRDTPSFPGSSFEIPSHRTPSSARNVPPKPVRNGSWLGASAVLVPELASVTGLPMAMAMAMADADAYASPGASAGGVKKPGTAMTRTAAGVNDYERASGEQFWDWNARIGSSRQHERQQQQVQVQPQERRKLKTKGERRSPDEGEDRDGSSDSRSDSSATEDECTIPAGKCTECTFSEQKTYEACKPTGKWQKFQCVSPEESGTKESPEAVFELRSCRYTDFDEGFAMFQFQIFCLLIGCLSFMSVRKQKRLFSSMFDRRKQQGTNNNNNNGISNGTARSKSSATNGRMSATRAADDGGNDDENEIEFTPMTNQEKERVPLMEIQTEHMEII